MGFYSFIGHKSNVIKLCHFNSYQDRFTLVFLIREQALLSKQGGNFMIFFNQAGSNKSEQGGKMSIFFNKMAEFLET